MKVVTDGQYINLMNFIATPEIEQKRLAAIRRKFGIVFVRMLPRDKYKEAVKYLDSGDWLKDEK